MKDSVLICKYMLRPDVAGLWNGVISWSTIPARGIGSISVMAVLHVAVYISLRRTVAKLLELMPGDKFGLHVRGVRLMSRVVPL